MKILFTLLLVLSFTSVFAADEAKKPGTGEGQDDIASHCDTPRNLPLNKSGETKVKDADEPAAVDESGS